MRYSLLLKNIELNALTNVFVSRSAVTSECGEVQLFTDKKNWGAHSLSECNLSLQRDGCHTVPAVTLDEFVKKMKIPKVDFIKIDTEGAEGRIIDGAENTLQANHLNILMEFWPTGLRNLGVQPVDLLRRLQGYGFKIKVIMKKGTELQSIDGIIELALRKGYINLFLEK